MKYEFIICSLNDAERTLKKCVRTAGTLYHTQSGWIHVLSAWRASYSGKRVNPSAKKEKRI